MVDGGVSKLSFLANTKSTLFIILHSFTPQSDLKNALKHELGVRKHALKYKQPNVKRKQHVSF